jgi:tetratricopeptide (TPR) repeat protein
MARIGPLFAFAAAVLVGTGLAAPVRAADSDEALRRRALALNDVTGNLPIEGQIIALTKDKDAEQTKKLLAVAVKMANEKNQPFQYNAAYILARAALDLKELETSRVFFRICAEQAAKLQSGRRLYIAYQGLIIVMNDLLAEKKIDESTKAGQEVLELIEKLEVQPSQRASVLRLMVRGLAEKGKFEEADRFFALLGKIRKNDWQNLELKAWLLNKKGEPAEAAKTYETLLKRLPKEKELEEDVKTEIIADIHYLLSGLYVDMKQIDKAGDHLKVLLAKQPDNATYNNDLGFIWADNDLNLEEAERLIRKAIEQDRKERKANPNPKQAKDKDNAAYLDSLGWVLYKQKKYREALPFLQEAVQDPKEGQHLEIYDHLGDVHLALGEKEQAIAAWKKGLTLPSEGKRDQQRKVEVEKKLKMHQP